MKNSLLALLLSVCSTSAFAQVAEINDLSRSNFTGVKSSVNGDVFYTGYLLNGANTGMDSAIVKLYTRELREMGSLGLSVPKKSQLACYTFTNEFVVLLFNNPEKKSRTTYVLDMQGNIVAQNTEENVKTSMFEPANAPLMFSTNPREFVLLQKGHSNGGYTLEGKDLDFKTKWTKTFSPEKGSWEIVQILPGMDRLNLLKKELTQDGKYAYSVEAVSLNDGSAVFNTAVNGSPLFMQINDEMRIVTGGVYSKNGKGNEKTEGIFFAELDPSGKISKFNEVPWVLMKAQADTSIEQSLVDSKTNILIQGITPSADRNGQILVGETYQVKSNGSDKPSSFTIGDLVMYQMDRDGKLISAKRIEKTHQTFNAKTSTISDFALATQLYRNGYFSYLNVAGQINKQYVVYKAEAGDNSRLSFYSPSEKTSDHPVAPEEKSRSTKPETIDINNAAFSNSVLYQNVIPLRDGQIMHYNYDDNRLTLRIQQAGMN